ncbi:DNA-binding protein [Streptococcus merionis]|uniref:DNA-binding protein n=1 Tax=Streptococcus merionis TaxID=400065 RepID=UPI003514AF0F
MHILSREAELEFLAKVDTHLEKRLELERQHNDGWDLIAHDDLKKKLGISATTLNRWVKRGLRPYQSPFDKSKKIYYRKSDVYNFLTVD